MNDQKIEKGSVLGGMLLVAGSAIGAGMLGLPIVTGISGFWPSVVVFLFCWTFMTLTALLLLEVNLYTGKDSNIISMAHQSLGNLGKGISFVIYIFLIYSMLIAYVDGSGSLTHDFFNKTVHISLSKTLSSLCFSILFGFFVFLGTLFVDRLNRLLMLGLILTYVLVLVFGMGAIESTFYQHRIWGYSLLAIPVVITSFGYHNVIPTLTGYLKGDKKKMIAVIILGGGFPLLIYILWEVLILGVVPFEVFQAKPTFDYVLSYIPNSRVSILAQYFAFFAIITSFLAQALALLDFLRDALKVKNSIFNRFWLILLVLIPPFLFAISYPGIFIKALGYVGGFAAIILFVLIPAFMVWELRYRKKETGYKIVPGGRIVLFSIVLIGIGIIALELLQEFFSADLIKSLL